MVDVFDTHKELNTSNKKYVMYTESLSLLQSIRYLFPKQQMIPLQQEKLYILKESNIADGCEKADTTAIDAANC